MFQHVEFYPGDPILGLVETFNNDSRTEKVNLGIGIYFDANGKLPVLGAPFRGRRVEARNSHLLIFLSPTIVDLRNLRPEAISALNFWREEKWKNLDRIEQEIEIMEDEL